MRPNSRPDYFQATSITSSVKTAARNLFDKETRTPITIQEEARKIFQILQNGGLWLLPQGQIGCCSNTDLILQLRMCLHFNVAPAQSHYTFYPNTQI